MYVQNMAQWDSVDALPYLHAVAFKNASALCLCWLIWSRLHLYWMEFTCASDIHWYDCIACSQQGQLQILIDDINGSIPRQQLEGPSDSHTPHVSALDEDCMVSAVSLPLAWGFRQKDVHGKSDTVRSGEETALRASSGSLQSYGTKILIASCFDCWYRPHAA